MAITKKDYEGIQSEIYSKSLYTLNKFYEDKPILVGSFDSEPTKRPIGSEFVNGDMYLNTSDDKIYVYEDGVWVETVSTQKTNQLPSEPDRTFDVNQGYFAGNIYHYNTYNYLCLDDKANNAIWAYYFDDTPQNNNIEPTDDIKYYFDYKKRTMYHHNGSEWVDISTPSNAEYADNANHANTADIALELEGVNKSDIHTHPNKDVLDHLGVNDEGKLTFNGNQVDTTIAQRDVYDGLDSHDTTISLSANMGRVLDEKKADKTSVTQALAQKLDKSDVYDALDSNSSTKALSARQGKVLNETKADKSELHSHSNKVVLDNLSEDSNGKLLYNGQEVGGSSLPENSGGEKILTADANNNLSWKSISDELTIIDIDSEASSTDELVLVRNGDTIIWKKKSEIGGSYCNNYNCKIILNKSNQGLSLVLVDTVSLALENNTSDTLGIIVNNNTEQSINANSDKEFACSNAAVVSTYQLPVLDIEVDNLSYSLLAQDTFRETVTNKTGITLKQSNDGSTWTDLNDNATTNVDTNIHIHNPNNPLTYQEPTKPTPSTPAHYSDVELVHMGDYRVRVDASSQFDCNVTNSLSVDIYDAPINDTTTTETLSSNTSKAITDNYFFAKDSNNISVEYQEPTRPPIPAPAHYSDVSLLALTDYKVGITASNEYDVNVTNSIGSDITPKDSNGNDLDVLANDASTVYTQDVMFSTGGYLTYQEPTRPVPPTPAHYSEISILSISDNIDVAASDSEDCNIINQTGNDIKVGATTVANNSNIVITENKTISAV